MVNRFIDSCLDFRNYNHRRWPKWAKRILINGDLNRTLVIGGGSRTNVSTTVTEDRGAFWNGAVFRILAEFIRRVEWIKKRQKVM